MFKVQWIGAIVLLFSASDEAAASDCASKLDVNSNVSSIIECLRAQENEIATLKSGKKGDAGSAAIQKISFATGQGPNDGKDNGRILSRSLRFHKELDDTYIRILYSDNLRVRGAGKACRWTIKVDGADCGEKQIYSDRYDGSSNANFHGTSTVLGYCEGLTFGWHTIHVWVSEVPHGEVAYAGSDCYPGWSNAVWTIEAAEVLATSE